MRIGLSYDLKDAIPAEQDSPDDTLEEYDSSETIDIISAALEAKGHKIVRLGGGGDFLDNIRSQEVDIVFNIAEGRGNYRSREAQVPAVLEMLDIAYTGSDPLCLSICLDKSLTKKLVTANGISTPRWLEIACKQDLLQTSLDHFPFPAIIKPASEGSSKGIRLTSLARTVKEAQDEVERLLRTYQQPVLVEEFIDGDEITVGIVGNSPPRVSGMMRILPKTKVEHFVYSIEVKRDYINLVEYECPSRLGKKIEDKIALASIQVFKTLGCRDFSRIDFRVSPEGVPYFIEINPLPGLGTYSDLVIMAVKMGVTHEALIGSVLDAALERYSK